MIVEVTREAKFLSRPPTPGIGSPVPFRRPPVGLFELAAARRRRPSRPPSAILSNRCSIAIA